MPLVNGHLALVDAPWALTAIAQKQFWPQTDLASFGDGRTREVLSVIISNWDVPGTFVRKPARECSRDEIQAEVWAQLKAHVRSRQLRDASLVDCVSGRQHRASAGRHVVNHEPLLINTAGSWAYRPEAVTRIRQPLSGGRLRAHEHRYRHHGVGQRGGAAGGQWHPRRAGAAATPCAVWELRRAGAVQAAPGAGPAAASSAASRTSLGERRRRHDVATPTTRWSSAPDWAGCWRRPRSPSRAARSWCWSGCATSAAASPRSTRTAARSPPARCTWRRTAAAVRWHARCASWACRSTSSRATCLASFFYRGEHVHVESDRGT